MAAFVQGIAILDLALGLRVRLVGAMPQRARVLPAFMSQQVADERRFFFEAPGREGEGPAVVSGGWERAGPDYRIRRLGFRYLGVEFVVSGRGMLRMCGQEFELCRGVAFAYGPGIPHEIDTDPRDRLSKYFVDFSGRQAARALRSAGLAPGVCQTVAAVEEVQTAFEHLLAAGRRGTPAAPQLATLHGRILLLLLSEVQLPSGTQAHRSRQTFLRCRDYLEKNYATIRTAEAAATACGVAPAYFSRLFRRFAGQPAYQYLMRLKMTQAAAILERQQLNVSETAAMFGMDPFHFSRAFRRVHGRPPIALLQG